MRLPLWILRWLHRRKLSRPRLRGGLLHSWLGDRLLDKALWRPTRESLARGWLVGFPISVVPFLPLQTLLACGAALLVRGNVLLCLLLQFLSNALTAGIHLPACYFMGELIRGHTPAAVWREFAASERQVLTGDTAISLYLGAFVIGALGGAIGYAVILRTWRVRDQKSDDVMP